MYLSKFPVRFCSPITKTITKRLKHTFNAALGPMVVTIIGANSRTGQILGLLLKQCSLVHEVRLFDYDKGSCGIALDLSHIDTNTDVKAYTGLQDLRAAILDAKIVVVCGGRPNKPDTCEYKLFQWNADYVRNIALYMSEFNPNNILLIGTPPVNAMVPLASEEYKKGRAYDSRKIMGMSTVGVIRGNTAIAEYCATNPEKIMCPIVGGTGLETLVPVLSQTKDGSKLNFPVADVLRQRIARGEENVLLLKQRDGSGEYYITPAFAKARFITSVIRGLYDMYDGVECAFVRQTGHVASFLPYMTSIIKLGRHGIQSTHMPVLDNFESIYLRKAAIKIRKQIEWGENYITGVVPKKRRCERTALPCPVIKVKNVTGVGDVTFDPTSKNMKKHGRLVPN